MAKKLRWYGGYFPWKILRVNRRYKDRLFRFLFQEKKDLLQLYNAINGSDYTDPEALEIVTMEDVIFVKMKNDLSFMIADRLNLYEHQSTYSPNMPLRGLLYFSRQYEGLLAQEKDDIYGSKLVKLPTPMFVIFYNGKNKQSDRVEQYLSDAFTTGRGSGCLECKAVMLNINRGHNQDLLEKCRRLWEYSEFISEVNDSLVKGHSLKHAINDAMKNCIDRGVMRDILIKNRAEVMHMLLTEYDEKKHMRTIRREGFEDGIEEGRFQFLKERIVKKIEKGKSLEVIAEELEIDIEEAKEILSKENSGTTADGDY